MSEKWGLLALVIKKDVGDRFGPQLHPRAPHVSVLQRWPQDQAGTPSAVAGWWPAAPESSSVLSGNPSRSRDCPPRPLKVPGLRLTGPSCARVCASRCGHGDRTPRHGLPRWRAAPGFSGSGGQESSQEWGPFNSPRLLHDIRDPS